MLQDFEGETRRAAASREAASRAVLRAQLAGLPQPENEYEVTIPELPEAEEKAEGVVEDAADLAARRKREAALLEQAELKKRSQVRHSLACTFLCFIAALRPSGLVKGSSQLGLKLQFCCTPKQCTTFLWTPGPLFSFSSILEISLTSFL